MDPSLNVLGDRLEPCSMQPLTGFFRDGCCNTGPEDIGSHTVCVIVTRWYGGKHLGGDRFRHVVEAVRQYLAQTGH